MQLSTLTDDELLRHVEAEHDTLTASSLETELIKRFGNLVAEATANAPLIDALGEHDIDTPDALAARLEQPHEFNDKPIGELVDALHAAEIDLLQEVADLLAIDKIAREFDIDTPDTLRAKLARIALFDQVMQDLTAPLKTLTDLADAAA